MYHRVFDRVDAVVGEQIWNFADFATALGDHARRRQQEGRLHARPPARRRPRTRCAGAGDGSERDAAAPARRPASLRPVAVPRLRRRRRREQPGVLDGVGVPAASTTRTSSGIAATTAGTLFLVVRVWGGVRRPVRRPASSTRPSTRWGRFRPYLLFAAGPAAAAATSPCSRSRTWATTRHARLGLRLLRCCSGWPTASSTSPTARWRRR